MVDGVCTSVICNCIVCFDVKSGYLMLPVLWTQLVGSRCLAI
jgi:hypothetical protein